MGQVTLLDKGANMMEHHHAQKNVFGKIRERFPEKSAPFLHRLLKTLGSCNSPFRGLTIIHNVPLTFSTILKIECLIATGAHVMNEESHYILILI
jgi:S-adenosylhomocysteine hydrolase